MALTAPLHHQDFLNLNMSSSPGEILEHRRRNNSAATQKRYQRRFQCDADPARKRAISPAVSLLLQITEIPTSRQQRRRKNGSRSTKSARSCSNESYHFPRSEHHHSFNNSLLFDDCFTNNNNRKYDSKNRDYFHLLLSSPDVVIDDEVPASELSSDTLSPASVHSPVDTGYQKNSHRHIDDTTTSPQLDSSWVDGSEKSMAFSQDLQISRVRPFILKRSSSSSSSSLSSSAERTKKGPVRAEPTGSHPLDDSSDSCDNNMEFQSCQRPAAKVSVPRRRSSLVSNLTRSFRSLSRAAVNSIASQNKMLTSTCNNSLYVGLSPRLTDERRPKGGYVARHSLDLTSTKERSQTVVNPQLSLVKMASSSLSTSSFNDDDEIFNNESDAQFHSVELKTYKLDHIFQRPVRYRDVRMNSDFLRLLAIETCMRRVGKLSDVIPGKARMAIPPRRGDLAVMYRKSPLRHIHNC